MVSDMVQGAEKIMCKTNCRIRIRSQWLAFFMGFGWFSMTVPIACECAYPMQFSIPEQKVIRELPAKDKDFASIIPGDSSTYIYESEDDYYQDYQRSFYAVTTKKGGWDCLRHYEILANGCIPYFLNLEECPSKTMAFFSKDLILEAMHLDGVSYLHIDHSKFNKQKYEDILRRLLEHTRSYLTSRKIAEYLLTSVDYAGGKVLFLTEDVSPDYLRCLTLIGLKEVLGDRLIDVPKIEHIYTSYPHDIKQLYGKGFTYTKIVEDLPIDRENIAHRIRKKEFELVIYGSVHRGLKYQEWVKQCYSPAEVIYLCGEDIHRCQYRYLSKLFIREWE